MEQPVSSVQAEGSAQQAAWVDRLRGIAEAISRFCVVIAGCCLMTIVVLITLNVIVRRVPFLGPITGVHETASFLAALLIGLSLPRNQLLKGNISVEMIRTVVSRRVEAVMDCVIALICLALCLLIAWRSALYASTLWDRHEVSLTLGVPFYPIIFTIGACFALLAFVFLTDLLLAMRRVLT